MKRNIIVWSIVPIMSTLYQFFIKLAAVNMQQMDFGIAWLKQAALTPWMWAALLSEIITFVVWMKILSNHDLSKAFPLSAIGYVLVLCTGWFIFHEEILTLQLIGSALILTGVWLIGTANINKETNL